MVTGQILGAGFVDDVGAQFEGVLQQGRKHGVIHTNDARGIGGVSHAGNGGYVHDLDQWIGRGFQ